MGRTALGVGRRANKTANLWGDNHTRLCRLSRAEASLSSWGPDEKRTAQRGERRNDEPGGGSGNACVVAAIAPDKLPAAVAAVRPLRKRRGGLCLVTDAQSVRH